MSGKFITLEGPEGCGKSTQVERLANHLSEQGIQVVCTREPGGTSTGEAIRSILQHDAANEPLDAHAELLLFAASRAQLINRVILPALERGEWVVCDRFTDSTVAYQGFGRGMDIEVLQQINQFAVCGRRPDLTILLDLEVERGFERLEGRYAEGTASHDRFEREERAFHQRVRSGYHELAAAEPQRFRVIDAEQSVGRVAASAWQAVREVLL